MDPSRYNRAVKKNLKKKRAKIGQARKFAPDDSEPDSAAHRLLLGHSPKIGLRPAQPECPPLISTITKGFVYLVG